MRRILSLFLLLTPMWILAQQSNNLFTSDTETGFYQLDQQALNHLLNNVPHERQIMQGQSGKRILLPNTDGSQMAFEIWESPTMAEGLAYNFPGIKTYAGRALHNSAIHLRMDKTHHGFHAMIFGPTKRWMVNPVDAHEGLYETLADTKPYPAFDCQTTNDTVGDTPTETATARGGSYPIGNELRIYRMAVSTSGEFTQFHGGTVEDGLSAVVTILHRINGVYERDISARFELVDSNHLVIFTDPNTDPFSGGDGQKMNTNQGVCDNAIGNDNYDIGHIFDVGGGGIANLQAVCNDNTKGRGFTSTSPPEGDFFAIDYAAHEIGHQFGGNHTFNNCGGDGPQAYEPGSATTIMGYAGLCGSNNVATNSDDHFHVISIQEMTQHSIAGNGYSCAEIISDINNTPPVISQLPPAGLNIPLSTPFELTGMATDMEDDSLTYCWEQFDLGPSSTLGNPQGSAPSFRVYSPTLSPTRIFPRIQTILAGNNDINEVLPTYQRALNFRLTIRDNHPIGGGVIWDDYSLFATEAAGPFEVTSQNIATNLTAGTFANVTWDVANTDQAPVNADSVNIYLSTPDGLSYPYLLAGPVANNGQASILIPDTLSGSNFRIKVKGHNNVFFNINGAPIQIDLPTVAGIDMGSVSTAQSVCAPDEALFHFNTVALLDFTDMVTYSVIDLPNGLTSTFESETGTPPLANSLSISSTDQVPTGTYEFSVVALNGDINDTLQLSLSVVSAAPSQVFLASPADGETNVATTPLLTWDGLPEADSYTLEVATDPSFSDILVEVNSITNTSYMVSNALPDSMQLYWRVSGNSSVCGAGPASSIRSFETEAITCEIFKPLDTPVEFNNLNFVFSKIEIEDSIAIRSINLKNIQGTYAPVSGLEFRLRPPGNSFIDLLTNIDCNFGSSFNFSIDADNGEAFNCPLSSGDTYLPEEDFSTLAGTNAQGNWRLFVYDDGDPGTLTNWELEICANSALFTSTRNPFEQLDIDVFPNPATNLLHIRLPNNETGLFLVYDMQGREILHRQVGNIDQVNVGQFPAGPYVYRWWSADGKKTGFGKFVKQ